MSVIIWNTNFKENSKYFTSSRDFYWLRPHDRHMLCYFEGIILSWCSAYIISHTVTQENFVPQNSSKQVWRFKIQFLFTEFTEDFNYKHQPVGPSNIEISNHGFEDHNKTVNINQSVGKMYIFWGRSSRCVLSNLYNILCTVNTQHTSKQDAIITIRLYLATCFGRDRLSSGQLRTILRYSKNITQWDPI